MGSTGSNLPQISTAELKTKLGDPEILFIDVRGASELAGGKLETKKFLNIPHTGSIFQEKKIPIDAFRNRRRLSTSGR